MTRYVATINVPGYMPMNDDPPVFDSTREAWQYLVSEVDRSWDEYPEDENGACIDAHSQMHNVNQSEIGSVYAPTPGYDGDHDLGLAYSVSVAEDDDDDDDDDAVAGFTAEITHDPAMPMPEGFDAAGRAYYVKITYAASGQSLTLPYYVGSLCDEPTTLDVVMSLYRDASAGALDHDDFCSEFGYDADSRSAYAIWQTCQTYNGELRRITGDDSAAVWSALERLAENY